MGNVNAASSCALRTPSTSCSSRGRTAIHCHRRLVCNTGSCCPQGRWSQAGCEGSRPVKQVRIQPMCSWKCSARRHRSLHWRKGASGPACTPLQNKRSTQQSRPIGSHCHRCGTVFAFRSFQRRTQTPCPSRPSRTRRHCRRSTRRIHSRLPKSRSRRSGFVLPCRHSCRMCGFRDRSGPPCIQVARNSRSSLPKCTKHRTFGLEGNRPRRNESRTSPSGTSLRRSMSLSFPSGLRHTAGSAPRTHHRESSGLRRRCSRNWQSTPTRALRCRSRHRHRTPWSRFDSPNGRRVGCCRRSRLQPGGRLHPRPCPQRCTHHPRSSHPRGMKGHSRWTCLHEAHPFQRDRCPFARWGCCRQRRRRPQKCTQKDRAETRSQGAMQKGEASTGGPFSLKGRARVARRPRGRGTPRRYIRRFPSLSVP